MNAYTIEYTKTNPCGSMGFRRTEYAHTAADALTQFDVNVGRWLMKDPYFKGAEKIRPVCACTSGCSTR